MSIVAEIAKYRACKLTDERLGKTFNFTKRHHPCESRLFLPEEREKEWQHYSQVWNAVEKSEKRKDSCLGRMIILALPVELTQEQRCALLWSMARHLSDRYSIAVDANVYRPQAAGDPRNHYAVIIMSARRAVSGGFGEKARELDDNKTRRKEILHIREKWAHLTNESLRNAGSDSRVDHRSLKEQGKLHVPTEHLGAVVTDMERKGIRTERGEFNREVKFVNRKIEKLQEEIDLLEKERESILRDKEALAFEGIDCTVKQTLPELEKQVR